MASLIDYVTPTIDLGSDTLIDIDETAFAAIGVVSFTLQIGLTADGGPVGSFIAFGTGVVTARYVKVCALVTDASGAALADLQTIIRPA